jgi:hypothetical protein
MHLHEPIKQSARMVKLQLRMERAQNQNYCSGGSHLTVVILISGGGDYGGDDDDDNGDDDRKNANYGKYCV